MLQAQITITQNHMPSADEQFPFRETILLPSGADPALTGEDISWDYSSLDQGLAMVDSFLTVGSAPFAYQIFFNNQIFYPAYKADYARKDADIDFGLVSLTNTYVFYKNNAQGLRNVGYGAEVNGLPTPVQNDPIDYIYEFPLNYGDEFTGHSESEVSIPTLGYFHRSQDRQTIVEGYGTLIMPDASYEVLKVKVILNNSDSLYIEQFETGFSIDQPEETIYQWLAVERIEPVLEISQQLGFGYTIRYFADLVDGISELGNASFSLSPNPAKDWLKVEVAAAHSYSYKIIDITGKTIDSGMMNASSGTYTIQVEDVQEGTYILEIMDQETGHITSKVWMKE